MERKFKTTFYSDFTFAEMFGETGIKDLYKRCLKEWHWDVKYFTEFVVALNWKIRERFEKDKKVAKVYDELWREADLLALQIFKGEDKDYYLRETD